MPWLGQATSSAVNEDIKTMLPDYSQEAPRRVRDVLDIEALGYRYQLN
ncbi:MAG: hypothetical protein R2865_07975 [Deinococcales bacterium]